MIGDGQGGGSDSWQTGIKWQKRQFTSEAFALQNSVIHHQFLTRILRLFRRQ
jgi:hypothetical protein